MLWIGGSAKGRRVGPQHERALKAAAISPLILGITVPLAMLAWVLVHGGHLGRENFGLMFLAVPALVIAYAAMIVLGLPFYVILRLVGSTPHLSFLVALALGLSAGMVAPAIAGIWSLHAAVSDPDTLVFSLNGPVVGAVFWLIARPDRRQG